MAACVKHYVAYGACEAGRDYNTTSMSVSQLHSVYLPTFKAAVEEGAASAMTSFNDLNGIPCTVNKYTIREILKGLYGLNGFVVSDANGIKECVTHGIAENDKDAGRQAAAAGLDMDMGTNIYKNHLKECLEDGTLSMDIIDEAVRRILSVKVWLGLFEHPYVNEEQISRYEPGKALPGDALKTALEAAQKSIVLLKNEDQILPLKRDALYPFGYGLSYTTFSYDSIRAEEKKDVVDIYVELENTGDRTGTEIVQDVTESLVRPVKELRRFKRTELKPGEKKTVEFRLNKKQLGFYDNEGVYQLESGLFRIYAGGNSRDCLMTEVNLSF